MNIKLDLFMVSDWRVGTGTGVPGYADRLVQRDGGDAGSAPAAPVVPAKTLIGVWRDSCELVAHALDSGPAGVWHDWLNFLFGGQYHDQDSRPVRPAALLLDGPLQLPGRLPDLLKARPQVAWAATFRKPGVAIDPRTGTAEPGKLRFDEMARAGLTLTGEAQIRGFDELERTQQDAAVTLLAAGARLLEGIGGRRRRGSGRCRLTLRGISPDFAVFSGSDVPRPPSSVPYGVADRPLPAPAPAASGWERAELVITVEQPVLAAATVQGNLVRGAGFLPGWCLMPEVARRLGGVAHALVRTGDLLVTAATPQSVGATRTLPMPKVFTHAKGNKKVITGNRLVGSTNHGKSFREGHVVPDGEEAGAVVGTDFTLRMHNTVHDEIQRPSREVGGVYIYRALAAGTVLRAEVRVRSGLLESGWEKRLAGRWRLGRSAKDDYGQARVDARPVSAAVRASAAGSTIRVWLLSELLVRDTRLRPSTDLRDVARALEQALNRGGTRGVTLTPLTAPDEGAIGTHRTESWHRGWRLPRPTLYGLAAGSCLTFAASGEPVTAEALDEVRAAGVGERRGEGFGQIEIDHDLLLRSAGPVGGHLAAGPDVTDADPLGPGEEGHAEARIFERAAWRAEIHRVCEGIMADPARRAELLPAEVTPTQLNGLREVVGEPSMDRSLHRLERLVRPPKGRRSWPAEQEESLRALFAEPGSVWARLALPEHRLTVTGDGVASLRAELRDEAVRVLLTACLAAHGRAIAERSGT
ncbi:RAMP superfamily CRISPR-associated protein [Nonomuraea cavernae]|uniref:CRISPR type III-associated protein domain-containing protein n=1 Tax=Nonomuraea cavernae TaxID=2045107 RepID=A0A917Z060_9ACTN|nr:RAMP superfamily CRISPR-associated protein [Nonomuraea cavernae]MCA2186459.1 hypothetical protein [Nonomuraea cavernae]GGO71146.1 hypothetical protein GCM10012289_36190 [Nonomuraea cavernae]